MNLLSLKRASFLLPGLVACFWLACGSDQSGFEGNPTSATQSGPSGTTGGGGDGDIDAGFGDGGGGSVGSYGDLCGTACLPGDGSCQGGSTTGGAGGVAATGGGGATTGGAGGGSAGAGGLGGSGGSGGDGSGGSTTVTDACHLVPAGNNATGQCMPSGTSLDGQPCVTASDCVAGLGCVAPGVCRQYCCGDVESCEADTYCAPAPLKVSEGMAPAIPVCTPIVMCTLLDDSSCPPDQGCSIVRVDGTTSCVTPGDGLAGDSCPCGPGYVCASGSQTCFKVCSTAPSAEDCPSGHSCQGGSESYPDGFGVCVEI